MDAVNSPSTNSYLDFDGLGQLKGQARKGGFASAPQESVHDWQPTRPAQRSRIQNRLGMAGSMNPARVRSTADSAQRPRRVSRIDLLIGSSPRQIRK